MGKKLVHGIGSNDADYVTQVFEDVEGSYSYRSSKRRLVWVCPYYRKWRHLLERCYSKKKQINSPTYKGCTVCDEWLTFSNFRKWMVTKDWEGKHLDKDTLSHGNKVYSPETCVFVSMEVNMFTTDSGKTRGKYLVGCFWVTSNNKFTARCSNPNTRKQQHLGYFTEEIEAHLAWKYQKHKYAVELSNSEYVTDDRVKDALMVRYKNYTIVEEHIK